MPCGIRFLPRKKTAAFSIRRSLRTLPFFSELSTSPRRKFAKLFSKVLYFIIIIRNIIRFIIVILIIGNAESLGADLLETLLKMEPSKEEEMKLKEHREESSPYKLGPPERFLKAVLDIPFAFKRVDAMLYMSTFDSEISDLRKSFETLEVLSSLPFSTASRDLSFVLRVPGCLRRAAEQQNVPEAAGGGIEDGKQDERWD